MNTKADLVALLEKLIVGSIEQSNDETREFYNLMHHLHGMPEKNPRRAKRYARMSLAVRKRWQGEHISDSEVQLLQELMDQIISEYIEAPDRDEYDADDIELE